ncbi:nucleotidyltransferase family protein [Paenibacillus sp. SI8]|uniref:nucleotidyltransferase domain-containing protein n=1 Tax=unclassified Paenibacillus TaxID=185978 RepID=UPI003466E5A6
MKKETEVDVSCFSKELEWMILLLQDQREQEEVIRQLPTDMDWTIFMELVRHHRVYPLVYTKLKEIDADGIPKFVIQSLGAYYKKNTFQMLYLSAEMERVCKVFDENQIRSLQLKGPVLSKEIYGDLSLRTSKDLDILVPFVDVEKVEEVLKELGYEEEVEFSRVLNDWKWRHHHISYFHHEKKVQIEVHWKLSRGSIKEPDFEELWERRRLSTLTSYPIGILGMEDLLLFLISHGARHGWFRLRWLKDIELIVEKEVDWNKLSSLQKSYQSKHLGLSLLLLNKLFMKRFPQGIHTSVSARKVQKLAQQAILFIGSMENLFDDSPPIEMKRALQRYLFSIKSTGEKWKYIAMMLSPSSRDAQALPLPQKFQLFYYPLRPFIWCWRRLRNRFETYG